MRLKLAAIAALLLSSTASAANPAMSSWGTISLITIQANGSAIVWFSGNISSTPCSQKSAFYASNETLVRSLHAGFLAGRSIRVFPTHVCSGNYDKIAYADFQ